MLEHLEFWTNPECPPMSDEDVELVKKLAKAMGIKVVNMLRLEIEKPEPVCQGIGVN